MKANIALEETLIGRKKYYMVINDIFYKRISKKEFNELAEMLGIKTAVARSKAPWD